MAHSLPEDLEAHLNDILKKFDRLKSLYEQYFMGIERTEPRTLRQEVHRSVIELQQVHVRNTTLRFKTQTLIQKWNIYQSYWNRTLREIEQGRYVRHVASARRRALRAGVEFPEEEMGLRKGFAHLPESLLHEPGQKKDAPPPANSADKDKNKKEQPARRKDGAERPGAREPVPAPSSASQRALQLIPGMTDTEVRELHRRVVAAQRSVGESVEMRLESLVAQLARQVPRLMAEHECVKVRFDVVTRDGKVKLRPSPVK